jgi:hypothetical protein
MKFSQKYPFLVDSDGELGGFYVRFLTYFLEI